MNANSAESQDGLSDSQKITLHTTQNSPSNPASSFDSLTKYVRVRSEPNAKFVMFDFAISDPALFVELVLPQKSFADFCENNQVVYMTEEQMQANDADEVKWRYGEDATLVGDNHQQMTQQA